MSLDTEIAHRGIVRSVRKKSIEVSLVKVSACSACHVKSSCGVADAEAKVVEVQADQGEYHVGEEVEVKFNQATGFKALFYGYLLPFLLVLSALIIGTSLGLKEEVSGLISLAVLLPYYVGLYLTRKLMKNAFTFRVSRVV